MNKLQMAVVAAVLVVIAALAAALAYEHSQVVEARKAQSVEAKSREAAELMLRGEVVVKETAERNLEAAINREADLKRQYDELKAKAPDVRVKYVGRMVTNPAVASGPPEAPTGRPCLLSVGDTGQVKCTIVGLETKLGNVVVRGKGEAVRVKPEPEAVLFSSAFDATVSVVQQAPPLPPPKPEPDRWAVMLGVGWAHAQVRPTTAYLEVDRRLFGFWGLSTWLTASVQSADASLSSSAWSFMPGARLEVDFK